MPKASQNSRYFIFAVFVIILDQLTKWLILSHFHYAERLSVIDGFFDLILVYNTGAAFSFLANAGGWQLYFFSGLAVLISLYLGRGIVKNEFSTIGKVAAACIIGGALGNVIDRILHGHVVDFLLFYYRSWSYPAFNIADSFICIGAFLLLWDAFLGKKHPLSKED